MWFDTEICVEVKVIRKYIIRLIYQMRTSCKFTLNSEFYFWCTFRIRQETSVHGRIAFFVCLGIKLVLRGVSDQSAATHLTWICCLDQLFGECTQKLSTNLHQPVPSPGKERYSLTFYNKHFNGISFLQGLSTKGSRYWGTKDYEFFEKMFQVKPRT